MKINLQTKLVDLNKSEIKNEKGEVVVVKTILTQALLMGGQDEKDSTVKYNRWKLLNQINDAKDEIDLTPEQLVELKKLTNETYGVLIFGQISDVLNGEK